MKSEFTLEGTNVLMAGCTVPDTFPIIPAGTATIISTEGAPAAGYSNFINSMDPIHDVAADNVGAADAIAVIATKVIDMQNYMKLTRGFTIGDTGAGTAGNCTVGTVGSNYQQAAISLVLLLVKHLHLHSLISILLQHDMSLVIHHIMMHKIEH